MDKCIKIVIPTYNRPDNFFKTLKTYSTLKLKTKLIILDGSDELNLKKNKKTISTFSSKLDIEHKVDSSDLINRLLNHFSLMDIDDIVCLGNDEDVFMPEYINNSYNFLINNPDYSVYVGRYLTYQKTVLGFSRISYWRDTITDVDIDQESPYRRLMLFQRVIICGSSPIFWGTRKVKNFIESLLIQQNIVIENSQELADQVYCSFVGKIRFHPEIMMWRDETSLKLDESEYRTDINNFINIDSKEEFINAFKGFPLLTDIEKVDSFLDWYFKKINPSNNNSYNFINHTKSYSRLRSCENFKPFNIVISLDKFFKILNEIIYNILWNIKFFKEKKLKSNIIFKF
jgi:glycosyltransferase domain-containing protein